MAATRQASAAGSATTSTPFIRPPAALRKAPFTSSAEVAFCSSTVKSTMETELKPALELALTGRRFSVTAT